MTRHREADHLSGRLPLAVAAWHRPQRAEVLPKRISLRENVAMAVGLAVLILAIRLLRLLPK